MTMKVVFTEGFTEVDLNISFKRFGALTQVSLIYSSVHTLNMMKSGFCILQIQGTSRTYKHEASQQTGTHNQNKQY